jgi:hypothetical protein
MLIIGLLLKVLLLACCSMCCCRTELEHLRQRLSSCKTVHDLFLLTEKAAYVAKTAAAACRKRAADKEPVSSNEACLHCLGSQSKDHSGRSSGSSELVSKGSSLHCPSTIVPSWNQKSAENFQRTAGSSGVRIQQCSSHHIAQVTRYLHTPCVCLPSLRAGTCSGSRR